MPLLSIDTCGATGTVALARLADDKIALLAQAELPGKTYSARLVSTIRDLLAANDLQLAALEAIVVTTGPGSFTGIRIGLST
ncbi:MAG TPA: tRNA (adenosine(37)-N6)-threonylcarbamoyltransferase complex dimerization subunit type 1 TsaB, partial [Acidobacteriaceae bacterium]|nr:tRNA (adenosine(37)-N6)-threonylcarbamoyltransferase complex dimerization subunit type 1 TsaB [Acidobacteriaceae bacterium]